MTEKHQNRSFAHFLQIVSNTYTASVVSHLLIALVQKLRLEEAEVVYEVVNGLAVIRVINRFSVSGPSDIPCKHKGRYEKQNDVSLAGGE